MNICIIGFRCGYYLSTILIVISGRFSSFSVHYGLLIGGDTSLLSLKMCQNDLSLNMEVVTQMLTRSKYTVDGLLCCCSDAALRTKSVVFGNKLYEKKSHCFEWWLLLLHNFALVCNPMTPYVQKKYDSMIGTTTMRYAICVLAFFQSGIFLVVYVLLSWEQFLVLRFRIFGGFLNQGLLNRVSGVN